MIHRRRKSKAVEIVLIMLGFGIAALTNALSRGTVAAEVEATFLAARTPDQAVVSMYDRP